MAAGDYEEKYQGKTKGEITMDTPLLAKYYKETDPMKRLKYLEQSIAEGEEPEANAVRKELWEIRYSEKGEAKGTRADGFFKLWMELEFCKGQTKRIFNFGTPTKHLEKILKKLQFAELQEKSPLHREMLYRECCHLVYTYMELCEKDKTYNSMLCGIMSIGEEQSRLKLMGDIRYVALVLPEELKMQKELGIITEACREMYKKYFPDEDEL